MDLELSGKRAVVTGASDGIGAAISKALIAEGAKVLGAARRSEAPGVPDLEYVAMDLAPAAAPAELVEDAVARFGGLDILVNNAGVTHSGNVESFPLEEFDRMLAVNVRAVFVAIRQAIPHLGTDGRIITTGSIFADHTPRPGSAVYAMTKAAVAGLTRGLARELGPRGITVNVIQPGPTTTDANPDSGEFADAMRERTAVDHYGRPEDIASAVAYLARPEAGFITGISWNVDGGFAA